MKKSKGWFLHCKKVQYDFEGLQGSRIVYKWRIAPHQNKEWSRMSLGPILWLGFGPLTTVDLAICCCKSPSAVTYTKVRNIMPSLCAMELLAEMIRGSVHLLELPG